MDLLPLIRLPCRREEGATWESMKEMVLDGILHMRGFSVTKTIHVRNYYLGLSKLTLTILIFCFYVLYLGLWRNKMYLKVFPIQGDMRMQLQHPVDKCNPLDKTCQSRYRSFDDLPYCKQNNAPERKVSRRETCEYMDEFDMMAKAFESSQLMLPTRISVLEQKQLCDGTRQNCDNMYETVSKVTTFNADVENFTLLIDHSVVVDGTRISYHAWEKVAFIRPCGPPHECPLRPLQIPQHLEKQAHFDKADLEVVKYFFDAHDNLPFSDGYKLPTGDIFRVGFLLDILGIDLDDTVPGDPEHSYRQEGLSFLLEVKYTNFLKDSRPNTMPIAFEYRFTQAPFSTYKSTTAKRSMDRKTRHVHDVHGLYVKATQSGHIGEFDVRMTLLMFLQAGLLISIARWVIHFVSLNWWKGSGGDELEARISESLNFKLPSELEASDEHQYEGMESMKSMASMKNRILVSDSRAKRGRKVSPDV